MLAQAPFQIGGEANVAPVGAARASQQIDVVHFRKVDALMASGMGIFGPAKYSGFPGYLRPCFALRASEGTLVLFSSTISGTSPPFDPF